jgi:hypothetical protein
VVGCRALWDAGNLPKHHFVKHEAAMTVAVCPMSRGWSCRSFGTLVLIFAALLFSSQLALAQFTRQGPKLVGTGAIGPLTDQGWSVALSADGRTAIVGGYSDNGYVGAAWVFTRSNGVWTQQGSKLVGNGAVGAAQQGISVALSADGNTAVVGGYSDNGDVGAAWVFTRSGGVWTQQGNKLVGTGAAGNSGQGRSVALSGDGNTAIVGGAGGKAAGFNALQGLRRSGDWCRRRVCQPVESGAERKRHFRPRRGGHFCLGNLGAF